MNLRKISRFGAAAVFATALTACSSTGGLGSILGGVLGGIGGGGGSNQVSGSVQSVDTRNMQVVITQSNGQSVALAYDNSTTVTFNNQNYQVTSLERGDQVTARVQQLQNGGYYTDLIQVDQSVSGNGNGTVGTQAFEGTVRQVNVQSGWFTMDTNNSGRITVTVPYNARSNDVSRFQNLRVGDYVRIYGTVINAGQVQLTQFY